MLHLSLKPKIEEIRKIKIRKSFESMDFFPKEDCRSKEKNGLAEEWLKKNDGHFGSFIQGMHEKGSGPSVYIMDEMNLTKICEMTLTDEKLLKLAYGDSDTIVSTWRSMEEIDRAKLLFKFSESIKKNQKLLVQLGNSLKGTHEQEMKQMVDIFCHCHRYWVMDGPVVIEPAGVVCILNLGKRRNFIPFVAWHISAALSCGNVVVVMCTKEEYPLVCRLAEIADGAGFPSGVFNVVSIDLNHLDHLWESNVKQYDAVYVNGHIPSSVSYKPSYKIHKVLTSLPAFAVFREADIDSACLSIMQFLSHNFGELLDEFLQPCEIYVQDSIIEEFVNKLELRLSKIKAQRNLDVWMSFNAKDASVAGDNNRNLRESASNQKCVQNTALKHGRLTYCVCSAKQGDTSCPSQEQHGTMIVVSPFRTAQEAGAMLNHGPKIRSISVWCERYSVCLELSHSLRAQTIWLNCFDGPLSYDGVYPLSGLKVHQKMALLEFVFKTDVTLPLNKTKDFQNTSISSDVSSSTKSETKYHLFYGGSKKQPDNCQYYTLDSGRSISLIPEASQQDLHRAIEAASSAKAKWANLSALERSKIFWTLAENFSINEKKFITTMEKVNFKWICRSHEEEIQYTEKILRLLALLEKPQANDQMIGAQGTSWEVKEPVGVIGIISPTEYPLSTFVALVGSAIASGNVVVAIPNECNHVLALQFCELLKTSGVPDGVINIITSSKATLAISLAKHPEVDALLMSGWSLDASEEAIYDDMMKEVDRKGMQCYTTPIYNTAYPPNIFLSKLNFFIKSIIEYNKTIWMSDSMTQK